MPFPAKTDRARILAAAMARVAGEGMDGLSLRSLATSLGLAPTALYRYFPSRAEMEAAIVAEVTGLIHARLLKAKGRKSPEPALRALSQAYVLFAREQPQFYRAFLARSMPCDGNEAAHEALWTFVLGEVTRVAGAKRAAEATVALWSFLHGFVELEAAGALTQEKPSSGLRWGLDAWFRAARR